MIFNIVKLYLKITLLISFALSTSYCSDICDIHETVNKKSSLPSYYSAEVFLNRRLHEDLECSPESSVFSSKEPYYQFISKEDHEQNINDLLQKVGKRIYDNGGLRIKNELATEAFVKIRGTMNKKEYKFSFFLKPKESINISYLETFTYAQAVPLSGNSSYEYYLNVKAQSKCYLKFLIQSQAGYSFPLPAKTFDFVSEPIAEPYEENFIKDFNGLLSYIKYILPYEGIDTTDFFQQRQRLMERNGSFLFQEGSDLSNSIPKVIYSIWLTSSAKPVELSEKFLQLLIKTSVKNPAMKGWKQFLYVLNKNNMLQTVQALSQTSIEIKEVDTSVFDGDKTIESLFLESVSEKKYGRASDILRYVLLKKGGIYSDIDNAYYHNLERLRTYSFFAGIEPMSCLVGNAVMGSSKDNPVILDLLKRVKTNLASDGGAAHYIKDIKDNGFGTIVKTGPLALSLSLYAAGEKEGYRNIILPPYLIYPSVKEGVYPQKDISKKINDVGKYSFGKHDWDSTWIPINQEKFGSVG